MKFKKKETMSNKASEYYFENAKKSYNGEDFVAALRFINSSILLYPLHIPSYIHRIKLFCIDQKYDLAFKDIEEISHINPEFEDVFLLRSDLFIEMKLFDKAIIELHNGIQSYPKKLDYYIHLGSLYSSLHDFDNEIKCYSHAFEFFPDEFNILYKRGYSHIRNKEYKAAIKDLSVVIDSLALSPQYVYKKTLTETLVRECPWLYYHTRGNAYHKIKNYSDAIKDFDKVIQIYPEFAECYTSKAASLIGLKEYEEARRNCEISLAIDDSISETYLNMASIHQHYNQNNLALDNLNTGISLDPEFPKSRLDRGNLLWTLNKYYTATIDFNAFILYSFMSQELDMFSDLEAYLQNNPKNAMFLLEEFNIDCYTILNPISNLVSKINDFSLLILYYERKMIMLEELYIFKAIINYYLGGTVPSFIEIDGNFKKDNNKSARKLFYLLKTVIELDLNPNAVFNKYINEIIHNSSDVISLYYLGHIYILLEETNSSIKYFEKSQSFALSKLMLAYLTNKNIDLSTIEAVKRIFKCFDIGEEKCKIDYHKETDQFDEFFSYKECQNAITFFDKHLNLSKELSILIEPIWKVYGFSPTGYDEILIQIRKIETEKVLNSIISEFSSVITGQPNAHLQINDISKILNSRNTTIAVLFDLLHKQESKFLDISIGMAIYEWKDDNPNIYFLFIQYFTLRGSLTTRQSFTLFIYLLNIYSYKKSLELLQAIDVFFASVVNVVKTLTINLGMFATIGLLNNSKPLFKLVSNELRSNKILEQHDYEKFRNHLWKHIAYEKDTLSEKKFQQKYFLFNWYCDFFNETSSNY